MSQDENDREVFSQTLQTLLALNFKDTLLDAATTADQLASKLENLQNSPITAAEACRYLATFYRDWANASDPVVGDVGHREPSELSGSDHVH